MRNLILPFSFLFLLILVVSCNRTVSSNEYLAEVDEIQGEELSIKDLFLGNPYSMTTVDNDLCIYDRYEDKIISVVDLGNLTLKARIVNEGKGPEEVILPLDLLKFPQKDLLWFSQRNIGCINKYDIENQKMIGEISFEGAPGHIQPMRDYSVGVGPGLQNRFGIYRHDGSVIRYDGSYPFDGEKMDKVEAFMIYQGYVCSNPSENYFAVGSILCDNLEFFQVTDEETYTISASRSYDAKAKLSNHSLHIDPKCIISYVWSYGTSEHCFMLYSGKTYSENQNRMDWGQYIMIFDWNGEHIKTLKSDREIRTFCVDEFGKELYALTKNGEGEYQISRYRL